MILGSRGGNIAQITLDKGTSNNSTLKSHYGWEITGGNGSNGGISIISDGSSHGIILNAIPPNGEATQGVKLSMIPQSEGSASIWDLNSSNGRITSVPNNYILANDPNEGPPGMHSDHVGQPTTNYVRAHPGIVAGWLCLDSGINRYGVDTHNNWTTNLRQYSLLAVQPIVAPDFHFNINQTRTAYSNLDPQRYPNIANQTCTSQSILTHLTFLYELFNKTASWVNTRIDELWSQTDSTINNVNADIRNWVAKNYSTIEYNDNTNQEVKNWVNSQGFAKGNFASANHKHYVGQVIGGQRYSFQSFGIDNPGMYYDADGRGAYGVLAQGSGMLYTGIPV